MLRKQTKGTKLISTRERQVPALLHVRNSGFLTGHSRNQHILHLPFVAAPLKNIFTVNKHKLKSIEALNAFRIHFLSVTVVTLQSQIKLQHCLLFYFTKQTISHFVSLIKFLCL